MAVELKVPTMGESITEVTVGDWLVRPGTHVAEDTPMVVVESDKVNLEVPAPKAGVLTQIFKQSGDTVSVGEVLGLIAEGAQAGATPAAPAASAAAPDAGPAPASAAGEAARVTPAARRALADHQLAADAVAATGPGGRLLKEDVLRHAAAAPAASAAAAASPPPAPAAPAKASVPATPAPTGPRAVERKRMSALRKTVARRLVEAQQTAALLTTFNEVDMSAVMALRKQHQDAFVERYGLKLGFMSFFVKAVVEGLKQFPALNARIEGDEVVYHNYYDIGVAVGGGRGLVVPVIRDAERLSFAGVEQTVNDFGKRARDNKITLEELQGGTFSITNGGVYGSLLSTPIINPPQSGILGMHGIKDRPVAVDGQVVIRPMMYIALTYDHRLVDGREAVSFLKTVKDLVEEPVRILLEV